MTQRLTTTGPAVATAIGNHEAFVTGGALCAQTVGIGHYLDAGRLRDEDLAAFVQDRAIGLSYVVFSYFTPIAWVCKDGTKHIVAQKFSVTTSKHQGTLYML